METHRSYMRRALLLARRGRGRTSPNPMVGAVVVTPDGVVAGSGYHEAAGLPHAEVIALDAASWRARGATLYCTLEPCCHVGRTGPCTTRIRDAGIVRVVAAATDPNPRVAGGGFSQLRAEGIEVIEGVCEAEAAALNAAFFTWIRTGRPHVTLKVAVTLDNRVNGGAAERLLITSAAANRRIHRDRSAVDAIAVGSSTIVADDPLLTPREAFRTRPLTRVIFDRRFRTSPAARVFSTANTGPIVIVTTATAVKGNPERARALEHAGAEIEALHGGDQGRISAALGRLGGRDITSLIVEGGPTLHRAFCAAGLVDAAQVFVAPRCAPGIAGLPWLDERELRAAALVPVRVRQQGPDVEIDYVHRAD
jgi:diaminohydroxyphosphoribosylaminopyrimidine deaminase/5-amino-6-(5-phosphoribosylamino)uracil reductase